MMKEQVLNTIQNFKSYLLTLIKRYGIRKLFTSRELYRLAEGQNPREVSAVIDSFLCPDVKKVETELQKIFPAFNEYDYEKSSIFENSQPWIGLHKETLQTPYSCFLELFEFIEENFEIRSMIDVGAAYGRAAIVKNAVFPHVNYTGYEIVKERADIASKLFKKFKLVNCIMKSQNIFDEPVPFADLYILYDFSNDRDIHRVLKQLYDYSVEDRHFLIAAEGASTIELIKSYFSDFYVVQSPLPRNRRWNIYASSNEFQTNQ